MPIGTSSVRSALRIPAVLAPGLMASGLLVLGFQGTLSAWTSAIQNDTNTAGTGALAMQETNSDGSITCTGSSGGTPVACSTINKYGGKLTMGAGTTSTTNIVIKNVGSMAAQGFTLGAGACTQSNNGAINGTATDLCSKMNITITSGATTLYTGTAAALATAGTVDLTAKLGTVAAGTNVPVTFAVTVDSSAGQTYSGLQISQPLTWTFSA